MLLRNLMAMDVEEMITALPLDAVVLIGGCDKTIPAELMGAISRRHAGDRRHRSARCWPAATRARGSAPAPTAAGCGRRSAPARSTRPNLDRAHDQLMPTSGTCMVMGTASTMACIAETLGFMLPGAATAPAVSSDRMRASPKRPASAPPRWRRPADRGRAKSSPRRRCATPRWCCRRPRGSTNALVHLAAIAGRAGITYDLDELDRVGRDVPVLLDLKPAGSNFMEDFHAGGGLPALWRRLKDHLDLSRQDRQRRDARRHHRALAGLRRRQGDPPARQSGGRRARRSRCSRGNLAPQGAAIKLAAATPELFQHEGPALVFDSLDDLEKRIDDPDLDVTPQTVMVLRNAGPIGAPGMPEAGALPIPKKLGSKGLKDMVRISDARMSGTAFGTVVLHVAPEAAAGGPLALVRDGDMHPARRQGPPARPHGRRRRARQAPQAQWKPPAKPARGYHAALRRHA